MPRIPDANSLGARPIPVSQRGVAVDRSGEIMAEGVAQFGREISTTTAAFQERQDRFSYAKARSAILQADIEARRSLEQRSDYGNFENGYREAMQKAVEDASGMIQGASAKALFSESAKEDIERGALDVHRIAWGREVDESRAALDNILEGNRTAALNAQDESSRAALIAATQEAINAAQEKNYIKATEAETLRQKWAEGYGEGFIEMQSPEEQVRLLSKPKGTVADFIDPDKRAVMLKRAEKEIEQEERARRQEARAIAAEAEARRERAQRLAADEAWKVIAAGGTAASIPRSIWGSLDGRDQMSILNDERQRLDGGQTPTDWTLYSDLYKQATSLDPDERQKFIDTPLTQHFDKLSPRHREQLLQMQAVKPGSADDLDAVGLAKQIDIATTGWKNKDKKGEFESRVTTLVNQRNRELGRKLNQSERQQIIDEMLIEGEVMSGAFWRPDPDRQFYQVFGTEDEARFIPNEYNSIPESERALIVEALKAKGLPATPTAVTSVWTASQGR